MWSQDATSSVTVRAMSPSLTPTADLAKSRGWWWGALEEETEPWAEIRAAPGNPKPTRPCCSQSGTHGGDWMATSEPADLCPAGQGRSESQPHRRSSSRPKNTGTLSSPGRRGAGLRITVGLTHTQGLSCSLGATGADQAASSNGAKLGWLMALCQAGGHSPVAATTHCHTFSGLKQHQFMILQFWRSEV